MIKVQSDGRYRYIENYRKRPDFLRCAVISDYIESFDATHNLLSYIAPSGYVIALNIRNTTPQVVHCTYADEWWKEYQRNHYMRWDPMVHWGLLNQGKERWSNIWAPKLTTKNNIVMERALKHGLKYGVAFAQRSDIGKRRKSFFNAARADREFTDEEIDRLWTEFIGCMHKYENIEILTVAEQRALEMTAAGMQQKEIGHLMGKSEHTVRKILQGARKALKAKTVSHAVAIAQQRGIIRLVDEIQW